MENFENVPRLSLVSKIIMYASGVVYLLAFLVGFAMIWFFKVKKIEENYFHFFFFFFFFFIFS